MKLNAAAQAAWNQPAAAPGQGQAQSTYQNGTQQPQQQSIHAPPGVPLPPSFPQQPTQQGQSQAQGQGAPFVGNGTTPGNGTAPTGNGGNGTAVEPQGQSAPVPQTPAQQVLMSAADRWGLLSLLAMIKNADPDQALLSVGTDLGTMGLDMQQQGCAFSFPSLFFLFCANLSHTGICTQRSSRLGLIRVLHILWNLIFIYPDAIMYSHPRQGLERLLHSVTRRCSSCSIRRRETRCRKLQRRSCKPHPLPPSGGAFAETRTGTTVTGDTIKSYASG